MPRRTLELAQKISSLWQGNKLLYCDPARSISETVRELRQLKQVRVASYAAESSEIRYETRGGARGSIDVDNHPPVRVPGEICLK